MKPLPFFLRPVPVLCLIMAASLTARAQQSLTGNYTLQSAEVTLSLQLTQQGNVVQGTLSGSTGASFQLSGQVDNGIGYGTCTGAEGSVFFEAYADGEDLTLSLIEPDQYGAPNYDQARYLPFKKTGTGQSGGPGPATGAVTGAPGLGATGSGGTGSGGPGSAGPAQGGTGQGGTGYQNQAATGYQNNPSGYQSQAGGPATGSAGSSSIGANEVGDPAWGLKFKLPQGWIKQQSASGAVVGHNTIAGMILVIPHMSQNLQEMQAEMMKGIQEEGSYLTPAGGLQTVSQNVLAGDYSGMANGTQVKARGFGVLSPNGGGAYLIALSTPDKLGQDLVGAAQAMVQSVQYFKVDVGDLVQHFAGNWSNFTSNTSTWICFCPDGTYSEQYESSYSGNFNDGSGNNTGYWGTAGQDSDRGRWTVRGNKDAGTIIVRLANGKEIYYEYQVFVERGEKFYSEYLFNGNHYAKSK
jgi:hypothetical protein